MQIMNIEPVRLAIRSCLLAFLAAAPVTAVLLGQPGQGGPGSDPSESRRTGIVVATEKAAPAVVSITVRRTQVVAYGNGRRVGGPQ